MYKKIFFLTIFSFGFSLKSFFGLFENENRKIKIDHPSGKKFMEDWCVDLHGRSFPQKKNYILVDKNEFVEDFQINELNKLIDEINEKIIVRTGFFAFFMASAVLIIVGVINQEISREQIKKSKNLNSNKNK